MDQKEYIQHWNYFCSLAKRLDETKDYVYHGIDYKNDDELQLVHAQVYSDIFKQIIVLAASEFETLVRTICSINSDSVKNILEMSRSVLHAYPRIIETEVITMFWQSKPLQDWRIGDDNTIKGLDWWNAYNTIKHNKDNSITTATLENAVLSLSALYIINLYLMKILFDNLAIAYYYPCSYFRCKYTADTMLIGEGLLPDFGNKSADEWYRDHVDDLFRKRE